jgi:hypothetical protein
MRCRHHNCSRVSVRSVSRALQTREGCAPLYETATEFICAKERAR